MKGKLINTFEYLSYESDKLFDKKISDLGKDGWELVSVVPSKKGYGFIFKRELSYQKSIISN